jgi:hypothetical protein
MDYVNRFGALFIGKTILREISFLKGDWVYIYFLLNPSHGGFAESAFAIGQNNYL